jgi:RNase P/RNase MRP subunit p29
MVPQMSRSVAQQMIAVRTASDKAVTLVNPTGRVNLARPSASSRGQRQQLSGKLLPRAQRAQLAALPKSGIDYGAMMALHDLWCKYVSGVLTNASPDSMDRLLQAIDWHGALVRVVASKNPIYVHRVGIVAKATQNTFVVVSDDGRSSIVPLKGSSFECSFECGQMLHVLLSGDSLKVLKCELQGG